MKILVTGGTGFIGSHLVEALVKRGYQVRCLVRETTAERINFLRKLEVDLIQGDLLNKRKLKEALQNIDIVYHIAGAVDAKTKSKKVFYDVNVKGTENILEASIKAGVKRFIHCSSVGVYGIVDKKLSVKETEKYNPHTDYERSKTRGERIVLAAKNRGMEISVIRPAIVYGPRDFSAIYKWFKVIKKGLFRIIGHGNNKIHMVYVKNLVEGMILAGEKEKAKGQIYNIADEKETTIKEIAKAMAKALEVKLPRIHLPKTIAKIIAIFFEVLAKIIKIEPPLTRKRVAFLTENRIFDISKAKKELGYSPEIKLEQGIKETVQWYKENKYL